MFSGPDAKRFDARLINLGNLGHGAFGRVERVIHDSVCLARKCIRRRRGLTIEELRQEGLTMRKLDHRHVVKVVATYAPRHYELCLLIWPAAVCSLNVLLEDIEALRLQDGDREDIVGRLDELGLEDLSAIEPSSTSQRFDSTARCPLEFLRHVLGCTARAMAHCHANDVRHLDIKPSNILLKPGRVYLADFGVSRDVSGQDVTTTAGVPGTERWRAPELYADNKSSMQLSDMYSLGLVYLNIATVLYNARLADFDEAMDYPYLPTREEQLRVREEKLRRHLEVLTAHSLVTPPFMFTYEGQETVRPRPITGLIARLIASSPNQRLSASKIDDKLSMLGGIHQIYHGDCCKRPISWVEDKWDKKFVAMGDLRAENARHLKKLEELEGRDKTYEDRLANARSSEAELQKKLRETEERCRALADENAQLRKSSVGGATGRGGAARRSTLPKQNAPQSNPTRNLLPHTRSTPTTPQTRPGVQHSLSSGSTQRRKISYNSPAVAATTILRHESTSASPSPRTSLQDVAASYGTPPRSPSMTSLIGSKLPRRKETPTTPLLNRGPSSTDSSMASSVFSRKSVETTATTPLQQEPVQQQRVADDDKTEVEPQSPTVAVASSSSRRTSMSVAGSTTSSTRPPGLASMKSWADIVR